jgi:hypothetical protein
MGIVLTGARLLATVGLLASLDASSPACPRTKYLTKNFVTNLTSCVYCQPGFFCSLGERLPCPTGKYADSSGLQACAFCPFGQYQDMQKTLGKRCLVHSDTNAFDPNATQSPMRTVEVHGEVSPTQAPTRLPTKTERRMVRLKQVEAILVLSVAPHLLDVDITQNRWPRQKLIADPLRGALSGAFAKGLVVACRGGNTGALSPYAQDITDSDAHVFAVELQYPLGQDRSGIIVKYSMAVAGLNDGTENDQAATLAAALSLRACLSVDGTPTAPATNSHLNTSLRQSLSPVLVQHNLTLASLQQLVNPTVFPFDLLKFHLQAAATAVANTSGADDVVLAQVETALAHYHFTHRKVVMLATTAGFAGFLLGVSFMLHTTSVSSGTISSIEVERSPLVAGGTGDDDNALPETKAADETQPLRSAHV